jgi:hypothetical protein
MMTPGSKITVLAIPSEKSSVATPPTLAESGRHRRFQRRNVARSSK